MMQPSPHPVMYRDPPVCLFLSYLFYCISVHTLFDTFSQFPASCKTHATHHCWSQSSHMMLQIAYHRTITSY